MRARLEKLKSIERLQKKLHELAMWKANDTAAHRDRLAAAHLEMIVALGEGLLSFGAAASAATRCIRKLELEISAAETKHVAELETARQRGARAKIAERFVERTRVEARREAEKISLTELIERSLQRPDSGWRKP